MLSPDFLNTPASGIALALSKDKGRGVFASRSFQRGDTIEEAPVLIIPASQVTLIKRTILYNYFFVWSEAAGDVAICLGFGSIYNHSPAPNAEAIRNFKAQTIAFRALCRIHVGEEIFTNYHNGRRNSEPYPFEQD